MTPGDKLRLAAAGQRVYAAQLWDEKHRDERYECELTATALEMAARIVDGDDGPLYSLVPSSLWTDEMRQEPRP